MVRILGVASLALAVVSAVSGHVLRHRKVPDGWETAILESYDTYHTRYIDLNCYDKHNTTFFDNCCHPLLKGESLSVLYDRQCFSSDDSDCEDGSSSVPHPTSYSPASSDHYTPTSSPPVGPTSSGSPSPAVYIRPSPEPSKSVEPTSTKPTSTPAKASPSPSSANTDSGDGAFQYGGFGTFFYQNGNAGACGQVHQDTDFVVAMDSALYNGDLCGKHVLIIDIANGKSVTATVADECPTCTNANSIDMSVAAFEALADKSVGQISIKWEYVG